MKQVIIPNYGLGFLNITKEYLSKRSIKNKLYQKAAIIIFIVTAAESIANHEAMDYMNNKDLENFLWKGSPISKILPKSDKRLLLVKKWDFLLEKLKFKKKDKNKYLNNLTRVIEQRNELIHFKPYKNTTEIQLVPKNKKIFGPDGKLYTAFRKTGCKIKRNGVINEMTFKSIRNYFQNIDELIFDYFTKKKTWPNQKFVNNHWGKKSPCWKYRKKFN